METLGRCFLTLAAAAALVAPVCAQTAERRATFTGGSGDDTGKCTIEVYVDGSADVEIRGDRGYLRTRSGQPAQWRRFECSGPMPGNPAEFRFAGIDGRGRQELIQEPGIGRGAAVVTIQDPSGGAEGYTFDLVWRGGSLNPSATGQRWGGMNRRGSPDAAVRACQNAVRERARRQYGLRDIDFGDFNTGGNLGRGGTIAGFFVARRGDYRDTYDFSCAVDQADGRVRQVDISQGGAATADRYARGYDATPACQDAAEQKIRRDGYQGVQYGWLNAGNRPSDRIAWTARAQRGNDGRAYDFDIGCTVNLDNGSIKSIQVKRR